MFALRTTVCTTTAVVYFLSELLPSVCCTLLLIYVPTLSGENCSGFQVFLLTYECDATTVVRCLMFKAKSSMNISVGFSALLPYHNCFQVHVEHLVLCGFAFRAVQRTVQW